MNNFIYLDLEADGLNPTRIWCVVTRENGVNTVHTTPDTLCKALEGSVSVVGHNLIGYDLPVLKRLWGVSVAPERIVDTLVLSRLYDPSRAGGHSLKVWGELRGSQAIAQLSDIVIGMERDQQHENEEVRNTTTVRVLKNRYTGETGPACWLAYDRTTGRLTEVAIHTLGVTFDLP